MATQDPGQESKSPEEIRAEIDQTRHELGDTVEALGAKTDVKGRAQAKVEEIKSTVKDKVPSSSGATTGEASGPQAQVQAQAQAAVAKVRENPAPVAVAVALLLGYLIGRRMGE